MEESEDPKLPSQEFMQRLLEIPENCKEKSLAHVSTVGPYELLEEIGRGGMGTVHTAKDTRNGQIVALKLMSSLDPQFRARFRLEAANLVRAAKGVASEYVVRPLEASSEGEVPHIAMEYVKGTSLSERIAASVRERKPIAVTEACNIMRQVAIGLGHLHDQSIIHRDIKPSNLICTEAGRVRILDFGIAKFVGSQEDTSENTGVTENHQILGTQEYMAPELFGGSSNLTERSDIYSLGATFYKLLTGFAPYRETEASRSESIAYSHAHRKITPVQHLRPDTPDRLAGIIHKMLSPRPANRYRTAQEVAAALDQFLEAPHRSRSQWKPALVCGLANLMCLLGLILTVQNKSGTVEVSVPNGKLPDDVKISVLRNGEEIVVLQEANNWTASVRNGEVQLDLQAGQDEFQLEQNSIVVKRFGKSIVSLIQRPALQQPARIGVVDDDRVMAEIIIRNGGNVETVPVGTPAGDGRSDASVSASQSQPLPQAPFWLFQASIPQVPDDEPNFIARLLKMPHLHVAAFGAGIRDQDFDEAIPTGDPSLSVRFDESKITGRTLQQMAKWQNLTEIHFGTMPHIEDNDLAALRDMQSLRTLDLRGTSVTDSGLQRLRNLEKLNELWLDGRPVSSVGLNSLQHCSALNYLSLAECSAVDDQGLTLCRNTPRLLTLNLAGTSVTDVGLREVGRLSELDTLTLDSLSVTGDGLKCLNECKKLTSLSLQRCSGITRAEVTEFQKAHPNCRVQYARETDPGFAALIGESEEWEWTDPALLPDLTSNGFYVGTPAISEDGLALAFSSEEPGGSGQKDIWVSRRNSIDEKWPRAINAGEAVNSRFADWSPWISPHGERIYFHSHRPGSLGGDIWVSTWDAASGLWQPAERLSTSVNTAGIEQQPVLSSDECELLVWTDRPELSDYRCEVMQHARQNMRDPFDFGQPLLRVNPGIRNILVQDAVFFSSDARSAVFRLSYEPYRFVACTRRSRSSSWESPVLIPGIPEDTYDATYSPVAQLMILHRELEQPSLWQMRLVPKGSVEHREPVQSELLYEQQDNHIQVRPEIAALIARAGLVPIQKADASGTPYLFVRSLEMTVTDEVLQAIAQLQCPCVVELWKANYELESLQGFADLAAMPKLLGFNLWNRHFVTYEHLELLARSQSLQELNMEFQGMDAREVAAVCRIKTLRRLYLSGTEIDDGAIRNVCRELPELELLHLAVNENCKIVPTAQILEPLIAMTKLADLDLSGNSSITDDCVPALGQMKQLLKLKISKTAITEDGFAQLKSLLPTTEITGP